MDEEPKPSTGEESSVAAAAEAASSPVPPGGPEPAGEERELGDLVEKVAELVDEIAAISDFRNAYRRQFCNLSRRIRLLAPMMEEAKEGPRPLPEASVAALRHLGDALGTAKELLRLGSTGSKIFLQSQAQGDVMAQALAQAQSPHQALVQALEADAQLEEPLLPTSSHIPER